MLDAYRDLIDDLLSTPTEIREFVTSTGEPSLSPEIVRLIAELRDRDRAVLERVQKITREEAPYLPAIHPAQPGEDEDFSALLDNLETARGDLVSLLINLSLKEWSRTAVDETGAEIALADEIERHVEFDELHRQALQESVCRS